MRITLHTLTISLCAALLLAATGCATPGLSAEGQALYDQHTQSWVDKITDSCKAAHNRYRVGTSKVDCSTDHKRQIALSFPNRAYYQIHREGFARVFSDWCTAVRARTGDHSSFAWTFRKEKLSGSASCAAAIPRVPREAAIN